MGSLLSWDSSDPGSIPGRSLNNGPECGLKSMITSGHVVSDLIRKTLLRYGQVLAIFTRFS